MPISGRPNANMNSTTVKGQLRMTVTHAVPKVRSGATGATRHVAMSVPSSSEPIAPHRQMVRERRNPLANRLRFSVMASISHLLPRFDTSGVTGLAGGGAHRPRLAPPPLELGGSAAGRGRGQLGRRGALDLAGGARPRLVVVRFLV